MNIFTIDVTRDYEYGQSLELDTELILDLNNNNIPVFLEIIGLSELLGVLKMNSIQK